MMKQFIFSLLINAYLVFAQLPLLIKLNSTKSDKPIDYKNDYCNGTCIFSTEYCSWSYNAGGYICRKRADQKPKLEEIYINPGNDHKPKCAEREVCKAICNRNDGLDCVPDATTGCYSCVKKYSFGGIDRQTLEILVFIFVPLSALYTLGIATYCCCCRRRLTLKARREAYSHALEAICRMRQAHEENIEDLMMQITHESGDFPPAYDEVVSHPSLRAHLN